MAIQVCPPFPRLLAGGRGFCNPRALDFVSASSGWVYAVVRHFGGFPMKPVLALFLLVFSTATICAQSAAAPAPATTPIKDPVTASVRMLFPRSQKNILGAIEAMPA